MSEHLLNELVADARADTLKWFGDSEADIGYHALALCGEAGELGNIVKKVIRGSLSYDDALASMQEELIDVFIYVLTLADIMDVDLLEGYKLKKEQNSVRFG